MRIIYLHGFISSPDSTKAKLFSQRLNDLGVDLIVPDLNHPSFTDLTISRVIETVEKHLPEGDSGAIIGSSMGGWAAALFARLHPERVKAMVLMAPAFNMVDLLVERFGPDQIEAWRREGVIPIDHAAYGNVQHLGHGFLEDARRWATRPFEPLCPTLILHGRRDEDVPIRLSEELAERCRNVELVAYDAGHRLDEVVDDVLERGVSFLTRDRGVDSSPDEGERST